MPKYTDDKNPFTEKTPDFEKRKSESAHITSKHSDRKPVIAYTDDSKFLPLEKYKYLVPEDTTMAQFMSVLRRKLTVSKEEAIFVFVNDGKIIPPTSSTIGDIYREHAKDDGFLYVKFAGENSFGGL